MVVKMMKWRPWPAIMLKKFQVKLTLYSLGGLEEVAAAAFDGGKLRVHIKWKGRKSKLGAKLGGVRKNFTAMQTVAENGIVEWNETFNHICDILMLKGTAFHPWVVRFQIVNAVEDEQKTGPTVIGTVFLDIGEIVSQETVANEILPKLNFPCIIGGKEAKTELNVGVQFLSLQGSKDSLDPIQRLLIPLSCMGTFATAKSNFENTNKPEKYSSDEDFSLSKHSPISEEFDSPASFDSESTDDCDADEAEAPDVSDADTSFTYDTLAAANLSAGPIYVDWDDDDNTLSNSGSSHETLPRLLDEPSSSDSDHGSQQHSVRKLISWKTRKFSFKSPKPKGEPLLNKACREEGGDDIDFCRRQSSSHSESLYSEHKGVDAKALLSAFGDDQFTIGSWEKRELISRDGQIKLSTHVFFGSIDQRSERAAGESACTALVAVIADWLHANPSIMPNRSQFDMLIREGSEEWRNLCEMEDYKEKFPDKHFDLETVLQAKVRPLSVFHQKSFVGFFKPDGVGGSLDFLQGAMTFDDIWEEIRKDDIEEGSDPRIYIVSWNDHFFILKVEREALYVIDTLGERLFEGCNQAFILRFDQDTEISKLPKVTQSSPSSNSSSHPISSSAISSAKDSRALATSKVSGSAVSKEMKSPTSQSNLASTGGSKSSKKEGSKSFFGGSQSPKKEVLNTSDKNGSRSPEKAGSLSPEKGFLSSGQESSQSQYRGSQSPQSEAFKISKKNGSEYSKNAGSQSPNIKAPKSSPKRESSASGPEVLTASKMEDCTSPKLDDSSTSSTSEEPAIKTEDENAIVALETDDEEEKLICRGKESCKAFISGFLAAVPLRELQVDIEKGLMGNTTLHHRLQIEFHYTGQ